MAEMINLNKKLIKESTSGTWLLTLKIDPLKIDLKVVNKIMNGFEFHEFLTENVWIHNSNNPALYVKQFQRVGERIRNFKDAVMSVHLIRVSEIDDLKIALNDIRY